MKKKWKGKSRGTSSTRPPPREFLVRVMGSDGKSEAAIPIWIPLSIMASSTAQNAGQSEVISQAVAKAVIDYGDLVTKDYYDMHRPIDIIDEIATVSQKASHALIMAGGSSHAAMTVEKSILGGGVLLVPSLNSKQAIRLSRSESISDMEGRSKKQVSWLETVSVNTIPTIDTEDSRLSGKEISVIPPTDSSSVSTNNGGFQTFKPRNLLPQWEARSLSSSGTVDTGRTERSKFAPLMNLFLPVPEEQSNSGTYMGHLYTEDDTQNDSVAHTVASGRERKASMTHHYSRGHGAVTCGAKIFSGPSDVSSQSELLISGDGSTYLDSMSAIESINTNKDNQQIKAMVENGDTTNMSYDMSYNSAAQGTMTTRSIISMQSKNGDHCGVKCDDFRWPGICPDENRIQSDPTETKSAIILDAKPDHDEDQSVLAEDPSVLVECIEVTPTAVPVPEEICDQKRRSTIQKITLALGRLNCGRRTKKKGYADY